MIIDVKEDINFNVSSANVIHIPAGYYTVMNVDYVPFDIAKIIIIYNCPINNLNQLIQECHDKHFFCIYYKKTYVFIEKNYLNIPITYNGWMNY